MKSLVSIAGLRAEFEPGTPEFETGVLSTRPRYSVIPDTADGVRPSNTRYVEF
jgi:hypothetical protein